MEITARYTQEIGEPATKSEIRQAMRAIDGDFIEISDFYSLPLVGFANASIGDYVAFRLSADTAAIEGLLASAVTFSQVEVLVGLVTPTSEKEAWLDDGSVDEAAQISIDRFASPVAISGPGGKATRRAFIEAMLRLFPSGIYEFHPAYGNGLQRWKVMPPLSAERRMKAIWDFVRSHRMEQEEWIPESLTRVFPSARISGKEGMLSHLWFSRGMSDDSHWREFREWLIDHLRDYFFSQVFAPAHFSSARIYAKRYRALGQVERASLRLNLGQVAWKFLDNLEHGVIRISQSDLHEDVDGLLAAAEWLGVDIGRLVAGIREFEAKTYARDSALKEDGSSLELDADDLFFQGDDSQGDYSSAPIRIYPASISNDGLVVAARILGRP